MATAHLSVKVGKVGKGLPHAEYISRLGKYEKKLKQGEKLEAAESGNMPKWAFDNPLMFWRAADQYERANGAVYREHEIALPRELNAEQRAELVRDWVRQELGDKHAYTWVIHNKTALDGGEQPHVHLMYSERMNDGIERDPEQYFRRYNPKYPERGGAKKHRSGETPSERKAALKAQRWRWEILHNVYIDRRLLGESQKAKISMASLAEQGIDRVPEPHMTPSESAAMQRKAIAERRAEKAVKELKGYHLRKLGEALASKSAHELAEQYYACFAGTKEKAAKARVEQRDWYREKRHKQKDISERIAALQRDKKHIEHQYRTEQARRENSFFGLGALAVKIKKRNKLQERMQAVYKNKSKQIAELEQQHKASKQEYDAKLKADTEVEQKEYAKSMYLYATAIMLRPLDDYKARYNQAKALSKGGRQIEAVHKKIQTSIGKGALQERLAYYDCTLEIERVNKITQAREQRTQSQTRGRGISR